MTIDFGNEAKEWRSLNVEALSDARGGSVDSETSGPRSVTVGLAYEVCRDRGVVTAIKEAGGGDSDEGGGSIGSRNSSLSSGHFVLGESTPYLGERPPLEKAFSSKTQMQLRVSRGKSYEGEEFSLSWKITLQVPMKPSSSSSTTPDAEAGKGNAFRKVFGKDKTSPPVPAAMTRKTILDGIVGHAEKGQLMAVMGSSGCGKSSFLDCLSMRNQSFAGNIFV